MEVVLPAIVATLFAFAFGAIWYGPVFGKTWQKLHKLKKKDLVKGPEPMAYGILRHFVTAFVIALIFAGVDTLNAILTVAVLWLAFTAMPALGEVIWAKKPLKLYAIQTLYELLSFSIMVIVIGWF